MNIASDRMQACTIWPCSCQESGGSGKSDITASIPCWRDLPDGKIKWWIYCASLNILPKSMYLTIDMNLIQCHLIIIIMNYSTSRVKLHLEQGCFNTKITEGYSWPWNEIVTRTGGWLTYENSIPFN